MNLYDFESYIDKKILVRGVDYYENGYVSSIEEIDDNQYEAEVEGSDLYRVEVELDDQGNITDTQCDCPYDMGEYCKHQVAVFLALRVMLNKTSDGKEIETKSSGAGSAMNMPVVTKKAKRTDVKEILSERTKNELVDFLFNLASEYEEIHQRIELNFGSGNDGEEIKQSIELIRTYIRKYSDKLGFVHYGDTYEAVQGAGLVLEKARKAFGQDKNVQALELILCVVHEMLDLLQSSDDSDGTVGGVIEEGFQLIDELLENEDFCSAEKESIFEKLVEEAANQRYDGWTDWRLALLEKCSWLAVDPQLRNKLEDHLLATVKREQGDSWSTKYFAEKVNLIRYQLVKKYDGGKKAQEFVNQNLQYSDFRDMAIQQAMQQKDFGLVIKLAQEGEEKDKGWPGLGKKWKEYRYKACLLSGKLDEQRGIAVDFILDGDFKYYPELKRTYDTQEWPSIYPKIIFLLENQKKTHLDVYTRILIEEGEKQKLLEYVQGRPSSVESFYKHLLPDFQDEVYAIFRHLIEYTAARANSRKDYQEVCNIIRTLKKADGHQQALQSKQMLLEKYPKRPAFRDELSKIKL